VVGMTLVVDADEVMFITEKGILMRTPVKEIRETGRGAQGVRLIRIDEGDRLVAMSRVDPEEEKTEGGEGGGDAPPGPEAEGGAEPKHEGDGGPTPE
jgi:DNA gyrase subunit A